MWQIRDITHELHPGEMHYDMGNMKAQLDALRLSHILLTDRKLHPEIFSQGMLHASVDVISHVRL